MAKLSTILQNRFLRKKKSKEKTLLKSESQSLIKITDLFERKTPTEEERNELLTLLQKYSDPETNVSEDMHHLLTLTVEVKAITNQAAILHGERIKKAQTILKKYNDGAFSAWLISTYGNRQTPYNFLQYYEFYTQMPTQLHAQIDLMPRQAIYTLASREGDLEQKEKIVKNYNGETKQELLAHIREKFPLNATDRRKENFANQILSSCKKLSTQIQRRGFTVTKDEKIHLIEEIEMILSKLKQHNIHSEDNL